MKTPSVRTTFVKVVLFAAAAFFSAAAAPALLTAVQDDHIVIEGSRTYMGNVMPVRTEIWIGDEPVWYSSGRLAIIFRYDLGKRISLNPARKLYFEEPLAETASQEPAEPERIQEAGWNYAPVFEWTLRDTGEEKVIDGLTCRLVILEGDADYSEEVREYWISADAPIDIDRYYRLIASRELRDGLRALYEKTPLLREGLAMESRTTTENPIAPTIVVASRISKLETAEPPPGIYDVPPDFTKVETIRELYAR